MGREQWCTCNVNSPVNSPHTLLLNSYLMVFSLMGALEIFGAIVNLFSIFHQLAIFVYHGE